MSGDASSSDGRLWSEEGAEVVDVHGHGNTM
jgi:hypothetical protein